MEDYMACQNKQQSVSAAPRGPAVFPYICKVCKKRFCQLSHLQQHTRIHTGQRPYVCSTCQSCFRQLLQLQVHRRKNHANHEQFKCAKCSSTFPQLSQLNLHNLRVHKLIQTQNTRRHRQLRHKFKDRYSLDNSKGHLDHHTAKSKGLSHVDKTGPLRNITTTERTQICKPAYNKGLFAKGLAVLKVDIKSTQDSLDSFSKGLVALKEDLMKPVSSSLGLPGTPHGFGTDDTDAESGQREGRGSAAIKLQTAVTGSLESGTTTNHCLDSYLDSRDLACTVQEDGNNSSHKINLLNINGTAIPAVKDNSDYLVTHGECGKSQWTRDESFLKPGSIRSVRSSSDSQLTDSPTWSSSQDDLPPENLSRYSGASMIDFHETNSCDSEEPPLLTQMCCKENNCSSLSSLGVKTECAASMKATGINVQDLDCCGRDEAKSIGQGSPPSDVEPVTAPAPPSVAAATTASAPTKATSSNGTERSFFNEFANFLKQFKNRASRDVDVGDESSDADLCHTSDDNTTEVKQQKRNRHVINESESEQDPPFEPEYDPLYEPMEERETAPQADEKYNLRPNKRKDYQSLAECSIDIEGESITWESEDVSLKKIVHIDAGRFASDQKKVIELRHKVCKLFDTLFPVMSYPNHFCRDTHAVEELMDQAIDAVLDRNMSVCYSEAEVNFDVQVVLCKSPRLCLQRLRRKVCQLLLALLPGLELEPTFNHCGPCVDELLQEVILMNS